MGKYKILSWGYNIKGINNATTTGPVNCNDDNAHEAAKDGDCDVFKNGPALFDLEADPAERTNLAASMPGQVATMLDRLSVLADQSVEPMQWTPPYQGDDYACATCPLHKKGAGPAAPWLPWL